MDKTDPTNLWIVIDNYGLPQWAEPEAKTPYYFTSREAAIEHARFMAENNPLSVISVYQLTDRLYFDGQRVLDPHA